MSHMCCNDMDTFSSSLLKSQSRAANLALRTGAEKYARTLVSRYPRNRADCPARLSASKRSPLPIFSTTHQSLQSSLPPLPPPPLQPVQLPRRGFSQPSPAMLARSCLRSTTLRSIPRQATRVGLPIPASPRGTSPHFSIPSSWVVRLPHRPNDEGVAGRFKESMLTTLDSAVPPPLPQMLPSRHLREI